MKTDLIWIFYESGLAEQVQKEGAYKWFYIAAAIVGLLIVLAVYYFLSDNRNTEEILPEIPVMEVEPDRLIEEIDPIGIDETELIAIIIENGQNLWNLALNYLGDPYLWPWIYYLNSDEIEDPKDFELEQVAFGYVSVYQWSKEHNQTDARNYLWAAGIYDLAVLDQVEGQVDPEDLRFARNR